MSKAFGRGFDSRRLHHGTIPPLPGLSHEIPRDGSDDGSGVESFLSYESGPAGDPESGSVSRAGRGSGLRGPGVVDWSLRLLADRVLELGDIDSASHETVRDGRALPRVLIDGLLPWVGHNPPQCDTDKSDAYA